MAKLWSWSLDGEKYQGMFATRRMAIVEAWATYTGLCHETGLVLGPAEIPLWLGWTNGKSKLSDFIDARDIVEDAVERAVDVMGEISEDWDPTVPHNGPAVVELAEWIDGWASRHELQPNFWSVVDEARVLESEIREAV